MDDGKVNSDPDLTSSISDVLLSSNNDKTDANDSTPTSSTDAASSFSGAFLNVSEDPISSTSSDVMEKDKLSGIIKGNNDTDTSVSKNLLGADGDVDLLDMNIANVSSEPINEDVEDIVQDLENLLGEPEPQHDFPARRKDKSPSKEKDLVASLDISLHEKCEPNIIPETSDIQSSEKNETDNLIQPESYDDQMVISEGSSNVVVESPINDSDILPDNQENSPVSSEEKNECVENVGLEKTEEISCRSEELNIPTSGQSEETSDTETIQEVPSEMVEDIPEVNEINEVNTVTSSEIIVDNEERPEEYSHSSELNAHSNEVKGVELKEADELPVASQKMSDDQVPNIPIETKDQELVSDDANAISCCDAEEIKECYVPESKANDEPDSLLNDEISEDHHHDETSQEVATPEVAELVNMVDDNTSGGEAVESSGLVVATEAENIELQHFSSGDSIEDCAPSQQTDITNISSEPLGIIEEITTGATSVIDDLEDNSNSASSTPTPTEEVFEKPVDNSSEVKDMSDDTSVVEVMIEVGPNRNVSSSSELLNNQVCDVGDPIIADCIVPKNLEGNSEISLEELKEIVESKEPVLAEIEDAEVSIPDDHNVYHTGETVPTDEPLCEEIEGEEVKSSTSEISSGHRDMEWKNVPPAEETVETDVTICEKILPKDEQSPVESDEMDNSKKSEEYSIKEDITDVTQEDITDTILEENSETVLEIIIEQPIVLDNPESDDNTNQNSTLDLPETLSIQEITEKKNDSTPGEEEPVENNPEAQEIVSQDIGKDKPLSPLVDNVVEEETTEDTQALEKSEIVDDLFATNENIADKVKDENFESSCVGDIETVEKNSQQAEAGVHETKDEVSKENLDLHPVECTITEEIEEQETATVEETSKQVDEEIIFQILPTQPLHPEKIIEEITTSEIIAITNIPSTEDFKSQEDSDAVEPIPDISEITENQHEHVSIIENEVVEEVIENVNMNQENEKIDENTNQEKEIIEENANPKNEIIGEIGNQENEIIEAQIEESENQENEVIRENTNQENVGKVSCSVEAPNACDNVEILKDDINTESAKPDQGNASQVSIPQSAARELETNSEDKGTLDLPKGQNISQPEIVDLDDAIAESYSITNQDSMEADIKENIDSTKLAEEDNIELGEPELVPVIEELCIKKQIIYEHKCDSHKTGGSNVTLNEQIQNNSDNQTFVTIEGTPSGEPSDLALVESEELVAGKGTDGESEDSASTKEILPEKNQCMADSTISSQKQEQNEENEELPICPEISHIGIAKIEKVYKKLEDVKNKPKQGAEQVVKEPDPSQENVSSSQREEVSSSDQHVGQVKRITSVSVNLDDSKVTGKSCSEIMDKTVEESSHVRSMEDETQVDTITEQSMEDQTTAAVQSILDNMLTEERSIERIIEKEEPPVVHSSYSSYEVQKAVQEIQGITQIVEAVVISSEDIDCISSSKKTSESEKENCAGGNIVGQEVVEIQMTQNKESDLKSISKLEDVSSIVIPESPPDDKIEMIDSPLSDAENQDAITQSTYEPNQEFGDVRSIEKQSSLPENKCSSGTLHIHDPVVVPSIDLSEESSSEEDSDEDKKQNVVSSSVTSTSDNKESHDLEDKGCKTVVTKHALKSEKVSGSILSKNESKKYSPRETRQSSRISEKMKPHNSKEDINQPLSVHIEEIEKEKPYSPKITIKPIKEDEPNEDKEEHKGSLKITITKQSDNTHSILKMCSPDVEHRQKQSENEDQNVVPKLVIKTSDTHSDQHSPKMSTRSSKQVVPTNSNIRSGSPRITIKPIIKPDSRETITSPLKITIKPIGKPEEFSRQQQRHSPKQSKNKPDEDHYSTRSKVTKSSDNSDVHSPKFTIKPVKPPEEADVVTTPKITIKPIEKPEEARTSPKITIKPVVRPTELETEVEDEVKQRIVLKINKGNLPTKDTERIGRESRKRELEDDKSEKLAKIKLKFSKDGDAHIVHKKDKEMQVSNKRQQDLETDKSKRFKADVNTTDSDDDVKLIETTQSPIVISEDSQSQDSVILIEETKDPLAEVSIPDPKPQVPAVTLPRKRGRPRKVPLVAREDFGGEQKEKTIQSSAIPVSSTNQPIETETTGRPKRSCRAQSVRDTLGIKPRKASKPRGGKRGAGAKSISMKPQKKESKKYK